MRRYPQVLFKSLPTRRFSMEKRKVLFLDIDNCVRSLPLLGLLLTGKQLYSKSTKRKSTFWLLGLIIERRKCRSVDGRPDQRATLPSLPALSWRRLMFLAICAKEPESLTERVVRPATRLSSAVRTVPSRPGETSSGGPTGLQRKSRQCHPT